MNFADVKKINIPEKSGCYQFFNKDNKLIYIGKAVNLKNRLYSYWQKSTVHSGAKKKMLTEINRINILETDSEIEALLLEANLIKKNKPPYNILLRDDKRFLYIKITINDEIPGVVVSRKIDSSGIFFGPFISASAVSETLKAIKKIWPYCSAKKISDKPCFYYQINRCTGVCGGIISREEYIKKIIKPIILFFEGKKKNIISDLVKQEKKFLKDNKNDDASKIKFLIKNINKVLENTKVLSKSDKYENDVVELAKILSLESTPQRIEGYDISNIFGIEAVGSMVVFSKGEADKSEYRKFKIKLSEEAGDVYMLKEVLERRFNNNWPLPDLVIVDGGKQQLNVAERVIKKYNLVIPVIAISKGDGLRSAIARDKLFFSDKKIELSLDSPVIHIIKRVRDEAHRFAISFHRDLRSKKFLGKK